MSEAEPLVSVVVPLHNGASTIERTLDSICRQTWENLEVIVVDDGSTDSGPALVEQRAVDDPRVTLVRQANAGVAAARNHGARVAKANFLAFIDADDLWGPEKIAAQMEVMERRGSRTGLVYTWAALIDENDRIYSLEHRPKEEGDVFRALCRANIVGNGSSPLVRREAFEKIGGYSAHLREAGAQGCEDLYIYLCVAEHYEFGLVPRHLTGYRVTAGNMSSDALRMLRSCELTLSEFRPRYPQYEPEFEAHRTDMIYWLLVRALTTGPLSNAGPLLVQDPKVAGRLLGRLGGIFWLMVKAHSPAWVKVPLRRVTKQGREFRPLFSEAAA
ncbi:MAG TPA: glycosyltransferase family 2 protein [Caulobacteraceae bacterium]|nr:glycosyltransferase family 2 protein [Caulobacteraceae bacterium]